MINSVFWNRQQRLRITPPEPPTPPAPGASSRLFMLGGQSNMDGRGLTTELPPQYLGQYAKCWVWITNGNFWARIQPGVYNGTLNNDTNRVGPLIPFAYHQSLAHPTDNLYFIIYAQGGTNLGEDWAPPSGPPYIKLMTDYTDAMAAASNLGITFDHIK